MKRINDWQVLLGLGLVALSALVYFVHYLIFRDTHHIFIYLLGDIAFVPIEVLLVTLIIHRLLEAREKRARLQKLNMVIGVFFTELGTKLLGAFAGLDPEAGRIRDGLKVNTKWSAGEFGAVSEMLRGHKFTVRPAANDLKLLKEMFAGSRGFILGLLENPNLLEHESFTDLLWAVSHLAEELSHRADLDRLPESDVEHIAGDIRRAYSQLSLQWLDYMRHLRGEYPYLFSLAVRTNPFDPEARAEVLA